MDSRHGGSEGPYDQIRNATRDIPGKAGFHGPWPDTDGMKGGLLSSPSWNSRPTRRLSVDAIALHQGMRVARARFVSPARPDGCTRIVRVSVLNHRHHVDLDQNLGPCEAVDDDAGAARVHSLQVPPDGAVDGLAVGSVQDEGVDLADVVH